jgi:hypothetical protein
MVEAGHRAVRVSLDGFEEPQTAAERNCNCNSVENGKGGFSDGETARIPQTQRQLQVLLLQLPRVTFRLLVQFTKHSQLPLGTRAVLSFQSAFSVPNAFRF